MNWAICPFIEQTAIVDTMSQSTGNVWDPPFDEANIPSLKCPSDYKTFIDIWGGTRHGSANIMVSYGDAFPGGFPFGSSGYGNPYTTIDSNLAGWGDTNNRSRGLFMPYKWNSIAVITDGTSNTVAISEAVSVDEYQSKKIKGGTAADWDWTAAVIDGTGPQTCLNRRDATNPTLFTGNASKAWRGTGGIFDGIIHAFGFQTVLPPNSPSCAQGDADHLNALMSATSHHPGGVHVGLGDASVRFLGENINCGDLTAGQKITGGGHWSGKSRYGVWGALGTPRSGETEGL